MCVRDTAAQTIYLSTARGGRAGLIRVGAGVGVATMDNHNQFLFSSPTVLIISCNKSQQESMVGRNRRHPAGGETDSELFQRLVEARETKITLWKTEQLSFFTGIY